MHESVLLREVLEVLDPKEGRRFLDGTFGRGGHSRELLEAGASVVAVDRDEEAVAVARQMQSEFGSRLEILHMNFCEAAGQFVGDQQFDGVLLDLGVSSPQIDEGARGFSFMREGPLDMRMDQRQELTAAEIVNSYSEKDLARIIFEYGGERRSRPIARAIGRVREERPIETTTDLAEIIEKAAGGRRGHLHAATKAFQGIRIEVNGELDALKDTLEVTPDLLEDGGILAIISFHELEDRMVKRFVDRKSQKEIRGEASPFGQPNPEYCLEKIGRWMPSDEEIERNSRSRSARLRAARKVNHG